MKKDRKYYLEIYDVKTWLNIHVAQLSYTRNLLLTFATACLGYGVNEYRKIKDDYQFCLQAWWIFAFVLLLISIVFGVLLVINECNNFRYKRKISRIISADDNFTEDHKEFNNLQNKCTGLEKRHPYFFFTQMFTFLGGLILLAVLLLL